MRFETSTVKPGRDGVCLIVEDSEFDQEKLRRILHQSHQGLRIEVATSLGAARRALATGRKALILLDNNLPDGLGAHFAMELATDKHHAETPVIMVSDWPSPFMWEKAASAGVLYVVNKAEFDARYVEAALKQLRGQKRRLS
tara:strand:+ start:89490 stop:89915 length:426 start_codon:yes stop_codon:yes gene_type:complete